MSSAAERITRMGDFIAFIGRSVAFLRRGMLLRF
jgi:hypothetical protein